MLALSWRGAARRMGRIGAAAGVLLVLMGCQDLVSRRSDDAEAAPPEADASEANALDAAGRPAAPSDADAAVGPPDATAQAPIPPERAALCARPADDAVRDVFCRGERLTVGSLRELEARLGLDTLPESVGEPEAAAIQMDPAEGPFKSAVLLGHSTALSGQLVSAINPRAIVMNDRTLLAFQRGAQKVEIATADRQTKKRNFYLITFKQACNQRAQGCLPGDLYTLALESNWQEVILQDDEDLKNTPSDCRMCHQRKRALPVLLMRELQGPWTHFFFFDSDMVKYDAFLDPSGRTLTRQYLEAKGSESFAGLPPVALRQTAGVTLQAAVREGLQPLQFPPVIEDQAKYSAKAGGDGRSTVWDAAYADFKLGKHLPLPYYKPNPADPAKLAALTAAYARYRNGQLPPEQLPDLSDVYPDDPQVRAEIGLQTEPAASAAETLVQACGACHNDALDQSVSRARFNVRLASMSRDELDLAIRRIELPPGADGAIPPHGMRQLDPGGRTRLLDALRSNQRSAEDDALLDQAAKWGMAEELTGY